MENKDKEKERYNRELDMVVFYTIAKRYGFCTPYCECGLCRKEKK
jgi:hypothetical protein